MLEGKHRNMGLEMGLLGRQSFKTGKPTLSCWCKSQGQHEEFMNQSCEMANTFFMPYADILYVFNRACGCSSCKSLQPVSPKCYQLSWYSVHQAEALQKFRTGSIWSEENTGNTFGLLDFLSRERSFREQLCADYTCHIPPNRVKCPFCLGFVLLVAFR